MMRPWTHLGRIVGLIVLTPCARVVTYPQILHRLVLELGPIAPCICGELLVALCAILVHWHCDVTCQLILIGF